LPGVAVLALILIPFIDRGPMVRLAKRTFAFAAVGLGAIAWTGLTAAAILTTPRATEISGITSAPGQVWQQLSPPELAGLGYFRSENCRACHAGAGKKGIGPDLTVMPVAHRSASWMIPHFKRPSQVVPGSAMPAVQLSDSQLNALAAFLLKMDAQTDQLIESAPDFAVRGAMVYQANNCAACHQINGSGMKVGPALNGVAERHDRDWLEKHFFDPQSTSKGTVMPAYKFSPKDLDALSQFLLALPKV
jgi:mono/diheme cytochrome c family protein